MRSTSGTSARRLRRTTSERVVAIDVESGSWAIGADVLESVDRLQAQWPDAYDIWCKRVGYRALAGFGGGSLRRGRVIDGVVNAALEAVVSLTIQGPSGQSRDIEAVIDTGFNDFLTLPPPLVAELGLAYRNPGPNDSGRWQ